MEFESFEESGEVPEELWENIDARNELTEHAKRFVTFMASTKLHEDNIFRPYLAKTILFEEWLKGLK